MGVSRDTFYRYREAKESGGIEALLHKDRRRPNLKNRLDEAIEQAVLAYAIEQPAPRSGARQQRAAQGRHLCQPLRRALGVAAASPRQFQAAALRPGKARGRERRSRQDLSTDLRRHLQQSGLRQALYDQTPITSADRLNDRVLPFFAEHEVAVLRILTDRGTEYCGRREQHDYQLYLAMNDIEHTRTKAASPQTNGICERFHKTILQEFYQIAFRKKIYQSIDDLQTDLDTWMEHYNHERTHQGKMCCWRTPMETLADGQKIWQEKLIG